MVAKSSERLWTAFPNSHLHCEVTKSGLNSFRVTMTLIDNTDKQIGSVEHVGTEDLPKLKEIAFERLLESLGLAVK